MSDCMVTRETAGTTGILVGLVGGAGVLFSLAFDTQGWPVAIVFMTLAGAGILVALIAAA